MTCKRALDYKSLTIEEYNNLAEKNPVLGNDQTRDTRVESVVNTTGWEPVIDCCSDGLGSNGVCPLIYDVTVDFY